MVIDVTGDESPSAAWQRLAEKAHRILESVLVLAGSDYAGYKKYNTFSELNAALVWAEGVVRNHRKYSTSGGRNWSPRFSMLVAAELAVVRNSLLTLHLSLQEDMMQGVNSSLERLRATETVEEFAVALPVEVVQL